MTGALEDLSARQRRGELSRAEEQRLQALLESSVEARLWHQAGTELDAEGGILPGDHDAAERVMQRMLAALHAPRARRTPRLTWPVAIAATLVVSIAAAAIGPRLLAPSPAPSRAAPPSPVRVPAPLPQPEPPKVASPEPVPSVVVRKPLPRPTPPSDAASLLRAAGVARREGDTAKAITLLDALQALHPASREARASDTTLGALHLQRGAPAAALVHFRRYTRAAPHGALAPEALWGEARALRALGRQSEAERTLQLLLERFPDSTYAAAQRAKAP